MTDPVQRFRDNAAVAAYGGRPAIGDGRSVAVIGGGASGALCATHLLRAAQRPDVKIHLKVIDRDHRFGPGLAYATTNPRHLLNVPADRMSAFPTQPNQFLDWVRDKDPSIDSGAYLPRGLYGSYLMDVLASAERDAPPGSLERLPAEAVSVSADPATGIIRVGLSGGASLDADYVILALGNLPRQRPGWASEAARTHRYIANPLRPGALEKVQDRDAVLLLGTGLTMVDVAVQLSRERPSAVLHAISRHGLLPHCHAPADPDAGPAAPVEFTPSPDRDYSDLVRAVRRATAADPRRWRAVVDSLRPRSEELWNGLNHDSQRSLLRRFGRYWDVHRHRMAPQVGDWITELRQQGRLQIDRGSVVGVKLDGDALRVSLERDGRVREPRFRWIVDCTGPATDISRSPHRLTHQILASGFAQLHPLRQGLATDPEARILDRDGRPHRNAFALGPPRRGGLFETTAIPEIREQARALAEHVLALG